MSVSYECKVHEPTPHVHLPPPRSIRFTNGKSLVRLRQGAQQVRPHDESENAEASRVLPISYRMRDGHIACSLLLPIR